MLVGVTEQTYWGQDFLGERYECNIHSGAGREIAVVSLPAGATVVGKFSALGHYCRKA